ncbi:hypothetical protein BGX27_001586 [Mortierella sp. AM989]|nr:hypothetical protein BGX27_001586 [Mortierella sp. AM989]
MSLQKRPANTIEINNDKDVKRQTRVHILDTESTKKNSTSTTTYGHDAEIKKEEDENNGPIVTKNTLMWFRTDLRLRDNKALYEASMRSKVGGADRCVIALFIISEEEWAEHDEAPIKIDFWMRNLSTLKQSMAKLSIPLVIKTAKLKSDLVQVIESVVKEMDISHVFWNADLMVDEQRRDKAVKKALQRMNIHVEECDSECIVPPSDVRTKTGNPYAVFTPYYNTWCKIVETEPHYLELTDTPDPNPSEAKERYAEYFKATPPNSYPHSLNVDEMKRLYPAGEAAAHERLQNFLTTKAKDYQKGRDVPIQEGTSVISPYLASGVITNRQCVVAAREANKNKITSGDEGLKAWIRELGWRSASTGTDAQPYFRVFNPLLQSQRFDPKGEYIRKWVPELRSLNDKQIHDPFHLLPPKEFNKLGYPKPIVDHATAKKKYVDEFKRVLALE